MSEASQNIKEQLKQEKGHAAHTQDAAAKGLDGKMDRPIKVTMLGAGSGFTPRLTNDILGIPGNRGGTIALVDIDGARLGVLEKLIADRGYKNWKVVASKERREVLGGSDYITNCMEVSGTACVRFDSDIPKKYGIDQCIGDTIGPGGLFKALRTVPAFLGVLRDAEELCPDAIILNYTNPMNMMMLAAGRTSSMQSVGLCHSVQGTGKRIAKRAGVVWALMVCAIAQSTSLPAAHAQSAYSWGSDSYKVLGDDNTELHQTVPVPVSGIPNGKTIMQISGGSFHALALTSDGQVYSWGRGDFGQLGNNAFNVVSQGLPIAVSGLPSGKIIAQIAAGENHSLALTSDGQVYSWGRNHSGQLGDGTTANKNTAVAVGGLLSGKTIVQIAAGANHSLALDSDGKVYSWGDDAFGQLGDDDILANKNTPVAVDRSGALIRKKVTQLGTHGSNHSLVLADDSRMYSWGDDSSGQLGDDEALVNKATPVVVYAPAPSGVLYNRAITVLTTGSTHNLVVDSDGKVYSWGSNGDYKLGSGGFSSPISTPVRIDANGALSNKTIVAVSGGSFHSLAVDSEGQVYSWGSDKAGQLGDNVAITPSQAAPVTVYAPAGGVLNGKRITGVSAASQSSFAFTQDASDKK